MKGPLGEHRVQSSCGEEVDEKEHAIRRTQQKQTLKIKRRRYIQLTSVSYLKSPCHHKIG